MFDIEPPCPARQVMGGVVRGGGGVAAALVRAILVASALLVDRLVRLDHSTGAGSRQHVRQPKPSCAGHCTALHCKVSEGLVTGHRYKYSPACDALHCLRSS